MAFPRNLFFIISRSSCTQMFFKTSVHRKVHSNIQRKTSVSVSLFNKISFQPSKRDFNTSVFLRILRSFTKQIFLYNTYGGCCRQFDKVTVKWWVSSDLFFLIETKNVGWFLLKRHVDLVRVCYLHIISRNHSNTLLLINLQKTKTCQK